MVNVCSLSRGVGVARLGTLQRRLTNASNASNALPVRQLPAVRDELHTQRLEVAWARLRASWGRLGLQEGIPRTQGGVSRLHWKDVSRPRAAGVPGDAERRSSSPGRWGCGSPDTPSCSPGNLPSTPRSTHDTTAAS